MDMWTFMWVFLSLAILLSILESIHRKAKRRRAETTAQQLHDQLRNQPYHVYTIQNGNGEPQQIFTSASSNAHIVRMDDLPPKYEDLIAANSNAAFVVSTPHLASNSTSQQPPASGAASAAVNASR